MPLKFSIFEPLYPRLFARTPNLLSMEYLHEIFLSIIRQSHSLDMAEAEFRRQMVDDPELKRAYKDYCRENGTSERRGFADFCESYMEEQDEVWNTLSDLDDVE